MKNSNLIKEIYLTFLRPFISQPVIIMEMIGMPDDSASLLAKPLRPSRASAMRRFASAVRSESDNAAGRRRFFEMASFISAALRIRGAVFAPKASFVTP